MQADGLRICKHCEGTGSRHVERKWTPSRRYSPSGAKKLVGKIPIATWCHHCNGQGVRKGKLVWQECDYCPRWCWAPPKPGDSFLSCDAHRR